MRLNSSNRPKLRVLRLAGHRGETIGRMPEWDAEIEVDEALARQLIGDRYPELDAGSLSDARRWLGQHGLDHS